MATLIMTRLVLVRKVGAGCSCASSPAQARAAEIIRSAELDMEVVIFVGTFLKTGADIDVGGSHRPSRSGQPVLGGTNHRIDVRDIHVAEGIGCLQPQLQTFAATFAA